MCIHFSFKIKLQLHTTCCFVLTIPPSPFFLKVESQHKAKGYCGLVSACVCICLCALCVGGGWFWRRRRCREQKHFADVAGKKEQMESLVVISRMTPSDGGPIPIQTWFLKILSQTGIEKITSFLEQSDLQVEMARGKKSLKNMFTSGAQGWCRSLRFPSWSISQSVGGWDSLLVHWDVTWGMLISVCLCLSPLFWPSLCL